MIVNLKPIARFEQSILPWIQENFLALATALRSIPLSYRGKVSIGLSGVSSGSATVTFPLPFLVNTPIFLLSVEEPNGNNLGCDFNALTTDDVLVRVFTVNGTNTTQTVVLHWFAMEV